MAYRIHALAAVAACALAFAAPSAKADVVINYDFSAAAGNSTPTSIGPATFSSPQDPGAFTFGPNGGLFSKLGSNVLSSAGFPATLDITFSAPQDAIAFDFATFAPDDLLTLTTNTGASETVGVAIPPGDLFPEGSFSFSGAPFTSVTISASDAANGTEPLVIADLTTIQVPEPATLSLLGFGFVGLVAARRWRPRA